MAIQAQPDHTTTGRELAASSLGQPGLRRDWRTFWANRGLLWLALPAMLYYLLFHYGPLYGLQLAFKDFYASRGIWGSPWVGLKHFESFFRSPRAWRIISNTFVLSMYETLANLPTNILLALMLNWVVRTGYKRFAQTVVYAPHFISMVVLVGMMAVFMNPAYGVVNSVIERFGGRSIYFFGREDLFRHMFVWSTVWQQTGWGTIIFLSALSAVDPQLYESARMDGASKPQMMWYIDLPTILPVVTVVTLMALGRSMNLNFEKALLFQTPLNLGKSEVIQTFVYKRGILNYQIGFGAAVGLFNSIVNFVLIVTFNQLARRFGRTSLF